MIETLWALAQELSDYLQTNFDPFRDVADILLVTLAIYWLLILIRGTRAGQILLGLIALFAVFLISQLGQLVTVGLPSLLFIPPPRRSVSVPFAFPPVIVQPSSNAAAFVPLPVTTW